MEKEEDQYCRAADINDFKLLIKSLNENKVDYFLIGGYALFTHGYERATVDIDIIVSATLETGLKVKKALEVFSKKVADDIDPKWFIQENLHKDGDYDKVGTIRIGAEIMIDVMFNACGETYETLIKHKEIIDVDGLSVQTIDLEGLLKTKQTVRAKDINDRNVLERALKEIESIKSNQKSSNDEDKAREKAQKDYEALPIITKIKAKFNPRLDPRKNLNNYKSN